MKFEDEPNSAYLRKSISSKSMISNPENASKIPEVTGNALM